MSNGSIDIYTQQLNGMSPQAYNNMLFQKLAQEPAETAERLVAFVRDRLREDMLWGAICPQTTISRMDPGVQISMNQDTFYEVVFLDANAAAAITDFSGNNRGAVVRAPRVPLAFHKVETDEFEVQDEQLLIYPYPIVRLVHEYGFKAMGDVQDLYNLQNAQRAVDYVDGNPSYKAVFGGGTVTGVEPDGTPYTVVDELNPINIPSIALARQSMSNRIAPRIMLITSYDHVALDTLSSFDIGDVLKSQVAVEGWRQPTVTGVDKIVTTKQDVFRPGNVWFFAPPEYLGKNRVLNYNGSDYHLWIDRRKNKVIWQSWVVVGSLIANVGSVVKLQLYAGGPVSAATPNATGNYVERALAGGDSGTGRPLTPGDVDPKQITDEELFLSRSLAEQGGRFPYIAQF